MVDTLPIDDVLPELLTALRKSGRAVLQAPPGAGKTTRVPLAIDHASLSHGRIIMLEPRRLAARTAAQRMADTLGEPVGQSVGYRVRGETKVSRATRIEVVTEGILTRMIQSDPELSGVGTVIFDEFHERSLHADLGLALTLEVAAALRDDLKLLVMSATLDAGPVATLLGDAPVITSQGQSHPVETIWLDRPLERNTRFDAAVATLVKEAAGASEGGILVFLPGQSEINRVASKLAGSIPEAHILPLYGALPFKAQQDALRPLASGRKIVLATSIAETSLTIPDIRVVVDAGRARRARFDPGSGMSRLVTERVTRAEADQRRGRAGRVAKGTCYRLWTKGEEGALAPFAPAEIEVADLSALALELAVWGSDDLPFLTPPPETALNDARMLLMSLGALEPSGQITDHGRAIAKLPLHPRLAHMLALGGKPAATLAALLEERDPLQGAGADLGKRLDALKDGVRGPVFERIRAESKRLEKRATDAPQKDPAELAALAYPDRIAMRRSGDAPRWLLSGGKGVAMSPEDPLARTRMLVVTDTDGHPREATIRTAIPITESAIRDVFANEIEIVCVVEWSKRAGRVVTQTEERLGSISLSRKPTKDADPAQVATAMLEGVRQLGLSLSKKAKRFRARVALAHAAGNDVPDMSDEALLDSLETWLLPHLTGVRTTQDWAQFDILPALRAMLDWNAMQKLDTDVPAHFQTPLGRKIDIDYGAPDPEISLRLQEMFGTTRHPMVAGRPLRVTLLSPAGRPVQTTMDIPGFWASSYADVRKDMRAQYPKHPWPEDPTTEDPTLRAKRRRT